MRQDTSDAIGRHVRDQLKTDKASDFPSVEIDAKATHDAKIGVSEWLQEVVRASKSKPKKGAKKSREVQDALDYHGGGQFRIKPVSFSFRGGSHRVRARESPC